MKRKEFLIFIIILLQINIFSYVKEIEIKDLSYSFFDEYNYSTYIQDFEIHYSDGYNEFSNFEYNALSNYNLLKFRELNLRNISTLDNYNNYFNNFPFNTKITFQKDNNINIQISNKNKDLFLFEIPTKYYIPQIEESIFTVIIPGINIRISKKGILENSWVIYFNNSFKVANIKIYNYFGYGNENIIIDKAEKSKTGFLYIEYIEKNIKMVFNYNNFGDYYTLKLNGIRTYKNFNFSFNISEKLKPSISVTYTIKF